MDDTEMGRPVRHERKRKAGEGGWLGNVVRQGDGEEVSVSGDRECGDCGKPMRIDFSGPDGSMGVSIARAQLAEPRCDGCAEERAAREGAAAQQEAQVETLRRRVEQSRVPAPWRTLSLSSLSAKAGQDHAMDRARAWARGDIHGLLLHGDVGRGKTLIAAAAAIERCALSNVRWIGVAKLLTELRMPFESPEYAKAVRRLDPGRRGVALVLDDLDKLKPTEHSLQPLYVAINGWLEVQQPLLVTMNRDLESLSEWGGESFGAALASRLSGYCEVVEIKGDDWRLAA